MVVKNSLKSETIESLSYKLSKIDTNVVNSFNRMISDSTYFDGEPTSFSSSKIVCDTKSFKLIVSGKNMTSGYNPTINSVRLIDKLLDLDIEVKGVFSLDVYKYSSASITTTIDGKKIVLKQTFDNFVFDPYDYFNNGYIKGVKFSITDSMGGVLEFDAGDMSVNEYSGFASLSLKDMILSVDEDYNVSAPVVVSHPDMKFAVANESDNNIKVTSNNLSEFEKNSSGELVIEGFGGKDKISGTSGNDYIDGGVGADVMSGGMGDDTYIVDNSKDKVTEASNQGNDTIITTLEKFSLAKMPNVENLTFDGIGDANLTGNKQNNIIVAGDGHDNLYGGLGNDILTGGAGEDAFVFNTKLSSTNVDTITDFESGVDWLSLNKKLFNKLAKSFTEDNLVYGDKAQDANDYLIFNSENNT
jgi:Ca2+-binding RTX toxin-like protein